MASRRPRIARAAPHLLVLGLLLLGTRAPAAAGAENGGPAPRAYEEVEKDFLKQVEAEDPETRARAFDLLQGQSDPRAVVLVLRGTRSVHAREDRIKDEQAKIEKSYETELDHKLRADRWFENSQRSQKDLDRYNAGVKKITKKLDELLLKRKSLENDYARCRAMLDAASREMGELLGRIPDEALPGSLDQVGLAWLQGKSEEDRLRWVESLAVVKRPTVAERIRTVLNDETADLKVRALALEALAGRNDPEVLLFAAKTLAATDAPWDLMTASIAALARLHVRGAIEPLIAFLGREDIARLRTDARDALVSLTGQTHGPYRDPWARWWEDAKGSFVMPAEPQKDPNADQPKKGVTFFGIHTFSDRILYILDVSGSMDQAPTRKNERGESVPTGDPPKIELARKEIAGAINLMNPTDHFNVILFDHQVVVWQTKMVDASDANKRRAIAWAQDQPPVGGTNIYDALEAGFRIALAATNDRTVDTIYFLTDGKPTAGKVEDPDRILSDVADWEKSANVTIHTVGLGDCDEAFLRRLAQMTHGTFVSR